ncbi:MAG TPA: c-type cytochrome [Gemmatimonadaceae bacterium]
MNERVPAAMAAVSSIIMVVYACATTPATTTTTNSPAPTQQPVASGQVPGGPPPGGPGGFGRTPLTDSARRVRDSVTAVRRDSAAAMVLRSIAGHENEPAEQVFKNIKIFKGTPAGQLVNIMNRGFGRSLGVSCGFCHVPGQWDSDQKEEKNTARLMFAMVQGINRDYLAKLPPDNGRTPTVSCSTCHRGMPNPNAGQGPPGGPRPAAE